MQIIVNNKQKLLGNLGIERAEDRIVTEFAKFEPKVISVELSTQCVKGPNCGLDKECCLHVRLRGMKDVVVTARGETLSKAISNAIYRSERAVARMIKRRSLRNVGRNSNFVFSIFR